MSRRPQGERDEELQRLRKALKHPCTMDELVSMLDVDRRTIYRYLEDLQSDGISIARVGLDRPTKYQIA